VIVLLCKACVSFIAGVNEEKRDEAVLSLEKGSAEVLLWGQDEWVAVSNSQIILEGDAVRTSEDGYVSLEFYNGAELKMDGTSELVFTEVETREMDGPDEYFIKLELSDGRAWLEHGATDVDYWEIELRTDVMNVSSLRGEYLLSNAVDDEYIYVMDGQVTVDFVDRSGDVDSVIETVILGEGYKSEMSDSKQRALLSRENVSLSEEMGEDDLLGDEFVSWNMGAVVVEEEVEEPEEDLTVGEEDELLTPGRNLEDEEEIVQDLVIGVSSPVSGVVIQEDAIAIEGYVSSGEVSRVVVTWSGNGEPFTLGLFEAGDETFRYVADVEYANFAVGENTYTIVAYGEDGEASNVVTVVITGEF